MTRRFTDFPAGDAILPNDVRLFSDAQYREMWPPDKRVGCDAGSDVAAIRSISRDRMVTALVSTRQTLQISSDGSATSSNKGPATRSPRISNCCDRQYARGSSCEGFLELVERDLYAIWWGPPIAAGWIGPEPVRRRLDRDLQIQLAETGRRLWVLDVTSDLGILKLCGGNALDGSWREQVEFGSALVFPYANCGPARDD